MNTYINKKRHVKINTIATVASDEEHRLMKCVFYM